MNVVYEKLKSTVADSKWYQNEKIRANFEPVLMNLCANYLFKVKHRGNVYDPVGKSLFKYF